MNSVHAHLLMISAYPGTIFNSDHPLSDLGGTTALLKRVRRWEEDAENFKGWQELFWEHGLAFSQRLKNGEPKAINNTQGRGGLQLLGHLPAFPLTQLSGFQMSLFAIIQVRDHSQQNSIKMHKLDLLLHLG